MRGKMEINIDWLIVIVIVLQIQIAINTKIIGKDLKQLKNKLEGIENE
jgi:hypothetical protein